ncbi:YcjF family protein [Thalassotalea agarivorans]|uniref:Putative membrane protein n=1 Tax=Thalassotalea agarivorans TaxID=349064 RepID=A0A1H9ZRD3_THASX|nr:TIGR01620 family protein [Thalassotalea agarivorans]SES84175.1 putative membrane protein [Thalassotalea agarivorans]
MTEPKDDFQQQILFEENITEQHDKSLPVDAEQVVFDNKDWQPEQQEEEEHFEDVQSKPSWIFRGLAVLISAIVGIELYDFFTVGFTDEPILTGIYALVFAIVFILASSSLIKELLGLRQLKAQQNIQKQSEQLLNDNADIDGQSLCQQISEQLPCDIPAVYEQAWADVTHEDYDDKELLELYQKMVLVKVDEKAIAEVAKFSSEATVLVALSPIALLDMMIMLWRNLKMIDKIAGLYGLKLGYWSRIKLIRQVFVNMAYAGASELIADFGTEMIGADLLGKLSGRMAQGFGAGMLTARLGIRTILMCRPIPYTHNKPRLSDVRKAVGQQIKALINKKQTGAS